MSSGGKHSQAQTKAAGPKAPGTAAAPGGSDQERQPPKLAEVKWYNLWTIKAAIAACVVFALAYATSLTMGIQGIQSIASMAFDPESEKLQDQYLSLIKRAHKFRQETYIARLGRVIPESYRSGQQQPTPELIKEWLLAAKVDEFVPLEQIEIALRSPQESSAATADNLAWAGQAVLHLGNYEVTLPEQLVRKEFQNAEELIKRNRGIRATWRETIQPTMVAIQVIIVLVTACIIGISMFWGLRKFRRNIDLVVNGFTEWSENDASFRFNYNWTGELYYLAMRFNHMADEVEENRNRRMYLEKVASWQIIARKLAHEIKNPLTPIQMMVTQLVRRYKGDDEEFRALLEDSKNIISEEVSGLRRMVDNFSRFAQMPQPKMIKEDLTELVRKVVELEKAGFPQHEITFKSQASEAWVRMDPQLIKQVLINIIKNAAEANPTNKGHIRVEVIPKARFFDVVIADDGPGIPQELQERIFEAYFTTKHSGPAPGMGLGLAICQKVMLEHGGDLKVKSKPGDTRFYLALPKARK